MNFSKNKNKFGRFFRNRLSLIAYKIFYFFEHDAKVILYAVWQINTYTVTYNYTENSGSSATKTSASVNYGSTIDLTPTATKSGYNFVGWNTNKNGTSKLSSLTMDAGNVTLYAIYVDDIAPTINALSANTNNWTNQNITLTGKATDIGSGLVAYQFSTNNSLTSSSNGWTTITNTKSEISKTYTVTNNGTYYFYVKDSSGNINKKSISITNIDKTSPSTPVITNSSKGNWTNSSITLSWTSSDTGGAGIKKYQYSHDNKTWADFSAAEQNGITRSDERNDVLYIRSVDNAGNPSASASTPMKIDKTAPNKPIYVARYSDNTSYTSGSWTNKTVYTDLTAKDGLSGIKAIQYSADKTNWTTFGFSTSNGMKENGLTATGTEPWGLTNRNDTRYFRAIDKAGNVSGISNSFIIRYDLNSPTVSLSAAQDASNAGADVSVTDNVKIGSVTVTNPNGTTLYSSTANSSSYNFTFKNSQNGIYTIKITDVAGNTTTKHMKIKFLFRNNDECTSTTGGWKSNYYNYAYGNIPYIYYAKSNGSLIIAADPASGWGRLGTWYTANTVSLSGYDYIRDVKNDQDSASSGALGVWAGDRYTSKKPSSKNSGGWVHTDLNISDLNDSRTIMSGCNGAQTEHYSFYIAIIYMYKIY